MARYAFLSEEWVEEARRIRAEYAGRAPAVPVAVRMNQVVRGAPFGDGVIEAYLDTTTGELDVETGRLENPDLTVTLEYTTAKSLLVDGDPQMAIQAFLSGRVKVDGDITKLLGALQSAGSMGAVDPVAAEVHRRLQDITE